MPSEYHNRGAKRAREARDDLNLGQDGPLADILHTIESIGGAHVVGLVLPQDVAGAYVKRPDMPLLVVSGADQIARQRFTLAHEFGHFRMGHDAVVDRQVSMTGYDHDPCEVEANSFAAEFLVPKQAILAWAEERSRRAKITLEDVVRLAWQYGVSSQMMRYRLDTCGVLGDETRRERLDKEIEEGLNLELPGRLGLEPLEDELSDAPLPRIPRALRGTLFGDLLAGEIDAIAFASQLGRKSADVKRMLVSLGIDQLMPTPE